MNRNFLLINNLIKDTNLIYDYSSSNKYNISGIFDVFTLASFKNYFKIIDFNINDNIDLFNEKLKNINFFFIETSWDFKGISLAQPSGKIQKKNFEKYSIPLLNKIKKMCKNNNIKIIIWNKEDPTNYKRFSYLIDYADYYFTSDINMIKKYYSDYKKSIFNMGFFIDPLIHNPIKIHNLFDTCFAGRVYPMHKNRMDDSNKILRTCIKNQLDLIIFDRIYDITREDSFLFYNEFKKYVYGKLTYYQVLNIYKYFKIIINLNTVQDSDTMFARRIYEVIGFKKNIISNYSKGVKFFFKNIFIFNDNEEELNKYLTFIKNNTVINEYNKHIEWRNTNLNHSFISNINKLLVQCKLDKLKLKSILDFEILVFFLKGNKNTVVNFKYCNYKLIEINNINEINNFKELYNKFDYITFLTNNNFYDEHYIIDNLLLIEYSQYEVVSKPKNLKDEYQVNKQNLVDLFCSMIRSNVKFEIKDQNLIFDNNKKILYSDRFGFLNNFYNLDIFTVNEYKILYNKSCLLKINVNEENKLFYNNKEIILNKGINEINLLDIKDKSFYFENNCSIEF